MGTTDAGTVSLLIKHLCLAPNGDFDWKHFNSAMNIYQSLRIPRTSKVLDISKMLGNLQEERSHQQNAEMRELFIQGEIMMNGTLPEMCPGATYNYKDDVMDAIMEEFCKRRDKIYVDDLIEQGESLFDELEKEEEMKYNLDKDEEALIYKLESGSMDPKERQKLLDEVLSRY